MLTPGLYIVVMDDEIDKPQLEAESEDETPIETHSALPVTTTTTPSKKARARQRAAERKKGIATKLIIPPPVPKLVNGVDRVVPVVEKSVESIPVIEKVEKLETEFIAPPASVAESASSSDAETIGDYPSEDEEEEEDPASPSPTPTLISESVPALALPAAVIVRKVSQVIIPTVVEPVYTGADHDPNKKLTAIITRTVYGLLMAIGLISVICLGQIYVIILVFVCQAVVYSELTGLFDAGYSNHGEEILLTEKETERERVREMRRKGRRAERDRWSRRISWYFFAATNYFLYGESLIYYFKHILTLQASFLPTTFSFAQHHRLISFGLYVIGQFSLSSTSRILH